MPAPEVVSWATEPLPWNGSRSIATRAGSPMSYRDAIAALTGDAAFRASLAAHLAASPLAAFTWETPPITAASADRPFEMVITESPPLAHTRPDPTDFERELARAGSDVAVFPNLGGDALLVVPVQRGELTAYGHLAAFVRRAPEAQRDALLRVLGETIASRLGAAPLWVSTAGLGVSWLHVRLDTRPKYYRHEPYRAPP